MPSHKLRLSFRLTLGTLLALGMTVRPETVWAHHGGGGGRGGGGGGGGAMGMAGGGRGGGMGMAGGGRGGAMGMAGGRGCGGAGTGGSGQAAGGGATSGSGTTAAAGSSGFNPLATVQANRQQIAEIQAWNQQRAVVRRTQQAAQQQFARQVREQMQAENLIAADGSSAITPHAYLMSQRRAQFQQLQASRRASSTPVVKPHTLRSPGPDQLLASD